MLHNECHQSGGGGKKKEKRIGGGSGVSGDNGVNESSKEKEKDGAERGGGGVDETCRYKGLLDIKLTSSPPPFSKLPIFLSCDHTS